MNKNCHNSFSPFNTLHRKLNAMREKYDRCNAELKELKKELKATQTSTNKELNAFRKAVGSTSTYHKNKKRRLNRGSTPNGFWNFNF